MLSVFMLSVLMINVSMHSDITISVIMLNV
jgi:hypothetical protein